MSLKNNTETKERPIIFSTEMVKAILDGKKTQTRRVIKPQPHADERKLFGMSQPKACHVWEPKKGTTWFDWGHGFDPMMYIDGPYQDGMTLWVRETWCYVGEVVPDYIECLYRADTPNWQGGWTSPIFMPRWASRITLEVVSVRVERVQEISDVDAIEEGVDRTNTSIPTYAIQRYRKLWDTINGAKRGCSWTDNPWVWAISFRRITTEC